MDLMQLGEGGLPSFLDMARQMQPQMQPMGASPLHALMYSQDQRAHDDMVMKALAQAEMRAKMDAQKTDEFSAAAPGRMDMIQQQNLLAKGRVDQVPQQLEEERGARQGKINAQDQVAAYSALKKIEPWTNMWDKAEVRDAKGNIDVPATQQNKALIQGLMKDQNLKFGEHDLGSEDPETLDKTMKLYRIALSNLPGMDKFEMGLASKEKIADTQVAGKITAADIGAKARVAAAQLGITSREQFIKVSEQLEKKFRSGEGLTPSEDALFRYYSYNKNFGPLQGAASKPGVPSIGPDGNIVRTVPPLMPGGLSPSDFTDKSGTPRPQPPGAGPQIPAPTNVDASPTAAGPGMAPDKLRAMVEALGEKYDPTKYDYQIVGGKVMKRAK